MSENTNKAEKLYLRDLGALIGEMGIQARKQVASVDGLDRSYALGRLMALHEVVALMLTQAKAFDLSPGALGLEGINPDKDLV